MNLAISVYFTLLYFTGARLEGPKLEPEDPRAEMGFPTADQGFSSIQGTVFGFCGIQIVFDAKRGQMQTTK